MVEKTRLRETERLPRDEAASTFWRDRISGGAVLLFFASYLLLSSVLGAFVAPSSGIDPEPASLSVSQVSLLVVVGVLAALGSLWLAAKLPVRLSAASVGLVRPRRRWLLFGAGLGLLGWAFSGVIGSLYVRVTGDAAIPQPELETAVGQATAPQLVLLLALVCLLVPVAEEIAFRRVLYTYARRWGLVVALVASSLVFGVFHGFGVLFFTTSAAGALFALAYERSNSLWPAIAAHATMNAAMFVAGWLLVPY